MICPRCLHDNIPGVDTCARCQFDLATLDLPAGQDRIEQTLLKTLDELRDLLKPRQPTCVGEEEPLWEAIRLMIADQIGAVLVVNRAGQLVGILTERDLLTKVVGVNDLYAELSVCDFMTKSPESVGLTDSLATVIHKMDVGGYRHLPIVQDHKPIGMISVRDVIRHINWLCQSG